jgi:hypothetical protein
VSDLHRSLPAPEPLRYLLYRYWFWGWLFRDASRSDRSSRTAALEHNVRQRGHLPVYIRRWATGLVALLAVGHAFELCAAPAVLTAALFVGASLSAVIVAVAAAGWALLSLR